MFIAIDPGALAGNDAYFARTELLIEMMLRDEEVRLPGDRRRALIAKAQRDGIEIGDALYQQIVALASVA
jgi:(2R)-3-sulfolactate dehydrogenase (NADP+)